MRIQVNAAGYHGEPVTLMCLLDERTGVLVISRKINYREERAKEDIALVTNMDLPDLDFRFLDKHLSEAIRCFFTRDGQGLLEIEKDLAQYSPKERIEMVGVDEGGRRYNIHDEITNGQMAVLMAVAFVENQKPITAMIDAANELLDFYTVTTI